MATSRECNEVAEFSVRTLNCGSLKTNGTVRSSIQPHMGFAKFSMSNC